MEIVLIIARMVACYTRNADPAVTESNLIQGKQKTFLFVRP